MSLATIADGQTAASWGEGKKNCNIQPDPAGGWVLIGWALGRSSDSTKMPPPSRIESTRANRVVT